MSGVKITGTVVGISEVKARFAALRLAVPEILSPVVIGPLLLASMRARFRAQISPSGEHWRSLAPSSRKGKQILWQTGRLYRSLGIVSPGQRRGGTATGIGFRVGVRSTPYTERFKHRSRIVDPAVYGRIHQQGLGVPKRRFIGVSAADVQMIAKHIRLQLAAAVK